MDYLLPQRLLAGESQGQIDAIQCHPVNLPLPSWPVPPHGRVALSAHVLVVSESGKAEASIMITSSFLIVYGRLCSLGTEHEVSFDFCRVSTIVY